MSKLNRILCLAAGSILLLSTFAARAQSESTTGYLVDQRNLVAKSGTGLCWRTGYWTPAMAIMECDPDLVKKPEPPKPVVVAPPPPPPPPPPKPVPKNLTLSAVDLFDFNKAVVTDSAKAIMDREVIAKLSGFSDIKVVIISGHTDRLGSQQYNQVLSEKRAKAVAEYLFSKGVSASKLDATGFGKTSPAKLGCEDKLPRAKLVECLAPNRRVVIEVIGTAK